MADSEFSDKLLAWHRQNPRQLPWKQSRDPYPIWVSEIILQQTRVDQGIPYFNRFLQRFPDLSRLANATEDELMQVWQGLGYYTRARNMLHTARAIHFGRQGQWPQTLEGLQKLKGIGPYTAAAIASFAFDLPEAVVDGNVVRVLSRRFGIDLPYQTEQAKKSYQRLASELMDHKRAASWNQAIMDFGATQCTPSLPDCSTCPFSQECVAFTTGSIADFPPKTRKPAKKTRHFAYLVVLTPDGKTLIRKRTGPDIWKALYEFPMVESADLPEVQQLKEKFSRLLPGTETIETHKFQEKIEEKQLLSHQLIRAHFFPVQFALSPEQVPDDFFLVDYKNLCNFAFPKIIDWFIREKIIPLAINKGRNDQ